MDTSGIFQLCGFFIGLLFGSFLNVCISRLPRHESIAQPRSRCPECKAPIRWYDNIPLVSWLLLRAHCRNCKVSIPWRYPLVELAVGLWFASQALRLKLFLDYAHNVDFGLPPSVPAGVLQLIGLAILGFLLIGLLVMDWQTHLLPDAFTLTGIAVALFIVSTQAIFLGPTEDQVLLTRHSLHLTSPGGVTDHGNVFLTGPESLIFGRIVAVCGAALILLAIRWIYKAVRHREGMGLGDVKLLAMVAAFLGFWPAVLALFIGVLTAALYAIVLVILGKATAASRLAFGTFLCIGGLSSAAFGERLINIYTGMLR